KQHHTHVDQGWCMKFMLQVTHPRQVFKKSLEFAADAHSLIRLFVSPIYGDIHYVDGRVQNAAQDFFAHFLQIGGQRQELRRISEAGNVITEVRMERRLSIAYQQHSWNTRLLDLADKIREGGRTHQPLRTQLQRRRAVWTRQIAIIGEFNRYGGWNGGISEEKRKLSTYQITHRNSANADLKHLRIQTRSIEDAV